MIALLLLPLALAFAFSGFFDDEIERIAEENGLDGFDPDEAPIYDDREVAFGTNAPDTLTGTNGDVDFDALESEGALNGVDTSFPSEVLDREDDAVIYLGAEVIARIEGAAGMTLANLRLLQAG